MKQLIRFRPHHFLCSLSYQGMGYSLAFIKNYDRIIKQLRDDETSLILVENGLDDICKKCPHKKEALTTCTSQPIIEKLDNAHAAILNFREGEILSFKSAKERICDSMSLEQFHEACAPCEWKKLSVCERALVDLKASSIKMQ